MNQTDQTWLENRILAAVDDDSYLDREEEKRIKEEGAAKGIGIRDIELVIRTELDKHGAVCERLLTDDLDRLLHQFTDRDRKLDNKEERNALDSVIRPAAGKKKGLDPRVAEEYVASFCKVNGVVRTTERNKRLLPVLLLSGAVLAAGGAMLYAKKEPERVVETKVVEKTIVETRIAQAPVPIISETDRTEIDDQLRRAQQFVELAQYTDPPEKSAKACLDRIKNIDPGGRYRGDEAKALTQLIVDHYIEMATKSYAAKDTRAVSKWLDRAKLMNSGYELIRDKEREFGVLKGDH